jgi:5-hydroxyisourate hydrolase-like protein (transthyretin family)
MSKSPITCHGIALLLERPLPKCASTNLAIRIVLDSSTGKPAKGVAIALQEYHSVPGRENMNVFQPIATGYVPLPFAGDAEQTNKYPSQ